MYEWLQSSVGQLPLPCRAQCIPSIQSPSGQGGTWLASAEVLVSEGGQTPEQGSVSAPPMWLPKLRCHQGTPASTVSISC